MAQEIIMPKAGSEMVEGEIVKWFKKEGDPVKEGEPLLEIVTDKVNMEIEADTDGILLKIVAGDGSIVPVVETIGWIGEEGEEIPETKSTVSSSVTEDTKDTDLVKKELNIPTIDNVEEVKESFVKKERVGDYDVCVVGGGPAGYVAAIKAAQIGGKVAIVEKSELGGTCLNRGCIPTKAYLHNADIIHKIKEASSRGIKLVNEAYSVDMAETVSMKNKIVKTLTGGIAGLMKSYGVTVFRGNAKITKDNKVVVDGKDVIDADKIIFAGGSKVSKLNIPGMDLPNVITSDDILDLETLPESMVILGGGVIACELGQAFAAFGTKVTMVIRANHILSKMDDDVADALTKGLKRDGVEILNKTKVLAVEQKGNKLAVKLEGKDDLVVDTVLVSTGRAADLSAVEDIDIEMDRGFIKVNEYMETSIPNIYAPGDVNGIKMLAHSGFKMGEVSAENAMGHHKKADLKSTPSVVYTFPEVASVGMSEIEAKKAYDIKVGKFSFVANGRALASNENEGFVKVIIDNKYHEILGVQIVGPCASEIINEAAALIEMEMTIEDVLDVIHGHPTYSEAFYEACTDCLDMCIHAPKKKK